jgi:hypothetical protein
MTKETKLRIHNITAKAALKFGSEVWVLKKRDKQRLEAALMKFLRHLLGIMKLDKKNTSIREKTGAQNTVKETEQYQQKWLQHVQRMDYQDKHCNSDQTDKGTWDDRGRDGRTNFTWRIKEQATRLTPLFEHDDDDDVVSAFQSIFWLFGAHFASCL